MFNVSQMIREWLDISLSALITMRRMLFVDIKRKSGPG